MADGVVGEGGITDLAVGEGKHRDASTPAVRADAAAIDGEGGVVGMTEQDVTVAGFDLTKVIPLVMDDAVSPASEAHGDVSADRFGAGDSVAGDVDEVDGHLRWGGSSVPHR